MTVEIDHDKWFGQSVTPTTEVQLSDKIDKNLSGVKIDVDAIKVLLNKQISQTFHNL